MKGTPTSCYLSFSLPLAVNPDFTITANCSEDGAARVEFTSLGSSNIRYRIDYVCTHEDSEPVSCVPTFQSQSSLAIYYVLKNSSKTASIYNNYQSSSSVFMCMGGSKTATACSLYSEAMFIHRNWTMLAASISWYFP